MIEEDVRILDGRNEERMKGDEYDNNVIDAWSVPERS